MSDELSQDWENREFIETVEVCVRKCVDFLNNFHESAMYRLSVVDQRLYSLERKLDFVEANLENCDPSKRQAQRIPFKSSVFDPEVRKQMRTKHMQSRVRTVRRFNPTIVAPKKSDLNSTKVVNVMNATQISSQKNSNMNGETNNMIAQQQQIQQQRLRQQQMQAKAETQMKAQAQAQQQKKLAMEQQRKQQVYEQQQKMQMQQQQQQMQQKNQIQQQQQQQQMLAAQQLQEQKRKQMMEQQKEQQMKEQQQRIEAQAREKKLKEMQKVEEQRVKPPPVPGFNGNVNMGSSGSVIEPGGAGGGGNSFPHMRAKEIDILVLSPSNGATPTLNSAVEIEYVGYLSNGKQFIQHREVIQLGKRQNIKGLEQGVMKTNVGSKVRLWIPSKLGYGVRGAGNLIPPNSDLTFELTVHRIVTQ